MFFAAGPTESSPSKFGGLKSKVTFAVSTESSSSVKVASVPPVSLALTIARKGKVIGVSLVKHVPFKRRETTNILKRYK